MHANDDDDRMTRWEQRTEVPLALASLLFLGAYAVHVLAPALPRPWHVLCLAFLIATWTAFAVDYAARWLLSGQGARFPRSHRMDALVLLLPLLRPLRVVHVYEAVQRRRERPGLDLYVRVMTYAGLSALLIGFAGSLAVYQQEHTAPGGTIRSFGDAVWWSCATLTTVGYGDVSPVTPVGRLVAAGLMGCGLALLGAVTGSFSSWLLRGFAREDGTRPPGDSPGAS
ncbi:potassium channel family protein [Streptomyces tsukubensis]|uniref:Ion transporter n=1 Tax=Streptomyces tsukubensis TaxID=83656 RepID=A0A1V4AF22_9ACTN|nr:potassium channel family protein [Streptomyces tsukubensis]OON82144.1 ion transporter [Streptomyces tsukubensis]QFR92628.1 two pore domain potassium channel family protein [Streptomyces tsukubensis]